MGISRRIRKHIAAPEIKAGIEPVDINANVRGSYDVSNGGM